jgi:hypothetical protein
MLLEATAGELEQLRRRLEVDLGAEQVQVPQA